MVAKTKPEIASYLKERGFKWTPQRARVMQEALALEGHFEAEDLAYRLRKKGERISKATVYRTLPLLIEAGLINEVIHGEKHHHYEPVHGERQHDHMICLKCGTIVEFEEKDLRPIEERICERHHFRSQKIVVEIFGYCKNCQ